MTPSIAENHRLPRRKHIRLPLDAYAHAWNTFHIVIDAQERKQYFDIPEFNSRVVGSLCDLANLCRCPITLYCLMPTHLHFVANPGARSLIDLIAKFKKQTGDLARHARGIERLWQRSFFDHRIRSDESEAEQYDYIRSNPVRAGLVKHPDDWPWTGCVKIE